MAIDRAAALRQAEKLLRLGKLPQAIAEYERVIEDQPGDLMTANTLGDLYVRAGQQERAVQQFARIAAAMERDGFVAKAAAIYKKILKIDPTDEPTLLKAAEIAAGQGLLADARAYFNTVSRRRRDRGDTAGVAQIVVRLASLDPLDVPARLAGAAARVSLGEREAAVQDLKSLVAELTEADRRDDVGRVLREILVLDPGDADARERTARASLAAGDLDAVFQFVRDQAAIDPELLLSLAGQLLRGGRVEDGLLVIDRLLASGEGALLDVVLLGSDIAERQQDAGYRVVLRAADAAAERSDWMSAASALNEFLHRVPAHVPTLTRLIEIAVDGGLEEVLTDAQSRLVDGHLACGNPTEARFIAEDLVSRYPDDVQHRERLTRVLEALGVADPETVIARHGLDADVDADVDADAGNQHAMKEVVPEPAPVAPPTPSVESAPGALPARPTQDVKQDSRRAEVDLSIVLDGIVRPAVPVPMPMPVPPPTAPADLDDVFARLRHEAGRKPLVETAEDDLRRGQTLFQCGQYEECLAPLESAARVPRLRFESASLLGRALRALQRPVEALQWTERAAEAPASTPEAGHRVLYELADALEQSGDTTRALAIFLELQSETAAYADLPVRIGRLASAEARG